MFCKKCGNRIGEADAVCPVCGAAVDRNAGILLHISPNGSTRPAAKPQPTAAAEPQAAPPATVSQTVEPSVAQMPQAESEAPAPQADLDGTAPIVLPTAPDPTPQGTAEPAPKAQPAEAPAAPQDPWIEQPIIEDDFPPDSLPDPEPLPAAEAHPHAQTADSKKDKHSRWLLKGIACFMALLMIALTIVSKTTDLFSKEQSLVKEVPYSGFTDSEKASFLTYMAPLSALCGETLELREMDRNDFVERLRPWDPAGLYAGTFTVQLPRVEPADPRGRYTEGYCAIAEADAATIAAHLGVPFAGGLNTRVCYSYNGMLYFDASKAGTGTAKKLTDAAATRIEGGNYNGWYYVTLTCDDGSESYCLASYDRQSPEQPWTLGTISDEALFDSGTKREIETDDLPFEMRQETITAQTAAGQIYAQYVVIYPYFSDTENAAVQQINALYESVVASYRAKAQDAEQSYARYVKRGFDLTMLPAYSYKICSVSCNQKGWISLLDETVDYTPETYAKAKLKAEAEGGEPFDAMLLPETTVSGYTVNTETGTVLHTQDLFGAEDEDMWALLCNAYLGSQTEEANTDGLETLGRQLYSAPWILTDNAVTLYYHETEGDCWVSFTLPFEKLPMNPFATQ